jgi:eukaryotic-like serine/threonine-protein kinase
MAIDPERPMNTVTPELRAIFWEALDYESGAERREYIERACGGDDELRSRVEVLLRAHRDAGDFLEQPILTPTVTLGRSAPAEAPGTSIGPYKLLEQIGEGGMGVVYMAEQTHPVRRKVALKIIKPGMDTKQVVARFEAERQALALMDHPNIAKVHDGGATEAGRPYFVMELVRGIPITDYCDREHLTIPERLDLFVLVCRAVQHAHQKGIIHRDLKPSNVLVTLIDGAAVPKVIDFGVAKATGGQLTDKSLFTGFAQLIGTPLYMSPEQADLSGVDVDTRSDIYALGVLLYELLTGSTPIDRDTLCKAAYDEIRRIIREQDPPTPSTRLSTLGAMLSTVSANRQVNTRKLSHEVRGELDWIVMKALEKDRARRYETANDFAADVMRHLTDQPVEACPPSAWYRFSKFSRRNRVTLTTAALVGLALVAGTAMSTWQAVEARKARRATSAALVQAQARADETQQVLEFLVKELIGAVDIGDGKGRPLTVTELLEKAGDAVEQRFAGRPLLEARFRTVLAETLAPLAYRREAREHAARAWEIRRRLLGPEHPETLATRAVQAKLLFDEAWLTPDGYSKAEPVASEVFDARRRVLGPAHPDTIVSMARLARVLGELRRFDEGVPLADRAVALAVVNLGEDHPVTPGARNHLGMVLIRAGCLDEGVAALRAAEEGYERQGGPLDPTAISALCDLGMALARGGRLEEARRVTTAAVDRSVRVYGFCHMRSSGPIGSLDNVIRRQGDFATLRDLYNQRIRELLATPLEPDQYLRHRRAVKLASTALNMVTLPPSVPADGSLALRSALQATILSDRWSGAWSFLSVVHYRLGNLDEAELAVRKALERKPDPQEHPFDPLVLTLIHARRGDLTRARVDFEDFGKVPKENLWLDSRDVLEAEARALLGLGPAAETDRQRGGAP